VCLSMKSKFTAEIKKQHIILRRGRFQQRLLSAFFVSWMEKLPLTSITLWCAKKLLLWRLNNRSFFCQQSLTKLIFSQFFSNHKSNEINVFEKVDDPFETSWYFNSLEIMHAIKVSKINLKILKGNFCLFTSWFKRYPRDLDWNLFGHKRTLKSN
jgi:hypothetical protein